MPSTNSGLLRGSETRFPRAVPVWQRIDSLNIKTPISLEKTNFPPTNCEYSLVNIVPSHRLHQGNTDVSLLAFVHTHLLHLVPYNLLIDLDVRVSDFARKNSPQ
jgi:hypothetical protein